MQSRWRVWDFFLELPSNGFADFSIFWGKWGAWTLSIFLFFSPLLLCIMCQRTCNTVSLLCHSSPKQLVLTLLLLQFFLAINRYISFKTQLFSSFTLSFNRSSRSLRFIKSCDSYADISGFWTSDSLWSEKPFTCVLLFLLTLSYLESIVE